jgi:uncharacterized protein
MMRGGASVYDGEVVHVRLRPRPHRLAYGVFSLLLDVDRIDAVADATRLFSRNRFNLLSFWDRDHGAGDGEPVGDQARRLFRDAGLDATHRITLLSYPRLLGYAFNPLSVFFGYDAAGVLRGLIYEVNNTVGERTSYVLAANPPRDGVHAQACAKAMYVSPFTPAEGRYAFRIRPPEDGVLVGVALHDREGALLRTHFRGAAKRFDDAAILRLLARRPLMTFKVIAAIHWEALRLFVKGVPVVRRHRSLRYSVQSGVVETRPG